MPGGVEKKRKKERARPRISFLSRVDHPRHRHEMPDGVHELWHIYIVMAYIVMAYIVMAYIVMAYVVMAYIVMAYVVGSPTA